MVRPVVIAICGARRSGKDTLAAYLEREYGFTHCKISHRLKRGLEDFFGFTPAQLETDAKDQVDPLWDITPREVMQFVGTEIFQYQIQQLLPSIGRTFWIRALLRHMEREGLQKVVLSDLRFLHEHALLRQHADLFCIRVHRKQENRGTPHSTIDTHASEQEYTQIPTDYVFFNQAPRPAPGVPWPVIDRMMNTFQQSPIVSTLPSSTLPSSTGETIESLESEQPGPQAIP